MDFKNVLLVLITKIDVEQETSAVIKDKQCSMKTADKEELFTGTRMDVTNVSLKKKACFFIHAI